MLEPIEQKKIFVYGSLRTGFYNYKLYLEGKISDTKYGKVKGELYDMPKKGYPALLQGQDDVYGEVMTLKDFEAVVVPMDKMENYYGVDNLKNEYNRIAMDVELEDGTLESCYVYYYVRSDKEEFINDNVYIENGDWAKFKTK